MNPYEGDLKLSKTFSLSRYDIEYISNLAEISLTLLNTTTTMQVQNEKCAVCEKTAYPMESIKADEKTYHKTCFKCTHCGGILKLGNYAALEGKFYCKPHFKALFGSHGNYSTGFGHKTPQQQHNEKRESVEITAQDVQ